MTECIDPAAVAVGESDMDTERQQLLKRARTVAMYYLENVETNMPDLLPDAFGLVLLLEEISTRRQNATIILTGSDEGLGKNQVAVTVEHLETEGLVTKSFTVPSLTCMDGTAPIANFFADSEQHGFGDGIPTDFHAIRGLTVGGSLELAIDQGSPDYYGAYTPATDNALSG